MSIYDTIKDKLNITDIAERYTRLEHNGRNGRVRGLCPLHQEKTPSFFVFSDTQRWHCFGCNQGGDVFDFYQQVEKLDEATTLRELAREAGVELQPLTAEQRAAHEKQRQQEHIFGVAVAHWQQMLQRPNSSGMDYATGRGWDTETIESAGLGYHHDTGALSAAMSRAGVDLNTDAARAVLATPTGSLIYPHFERGRVKYYAARNIHTKQHWNPPANLVGPRQPYYNHHYTRQAESVTVIEGQGDGVTLGHWNLPAVALAGTAVSKELVDQLRKHKVVYIGVENNAAGRQAARKLAGQLGALCRLIYWPGQEENDGYDANDWLRDGANAGDLDMLQAAAPTWLDILLNEAEAASAVDAQDALKRVFSALVHVDQFALTKLQSDICKRLDLDKSTFTKLLQVARMEAGLDQHGRPLYEIIGGQMCRRVYDRYGGESITPLAAFSAQIVEDVVEDDGQTQTRHFVLEGKLSDGAPLPQTRVKADDFSSMSWVVPEWGSRAMVMAGSGTRDHLRAAIQTLSKEVEVRHEYAHLGWREIEGDLVYLASNGAIGKPDVTVNIHQDLQRYHLPLEDVDTDRAREAARASLRYLEIGNYEITIPLLTAMYLSPLASVMPPAFTLWLFGTTGSMKSTAAALAMCHFGTFSYNLPAPGSWTSTTAYALRVKSFLCKDAPLWVDDYAKQSTTSGERELRKLAETLLREWGNRSGRSAGQADGSLRQTHDPRGMVISTAEQLPPNPSIHPRLYAVEIHPGDITHGPDSNLTRAQNNDADLYPTAMVCYLRWLAPQIASGGDFAQKLKERKHQLTEKARKSMGQHLRSPANVATMGVGWEMLINFIHSTGIIDQEQRDGWLKLGWDVLVAIGAQQDEEVNREEDPVQMYLDGLEQLILQGRVFLRHRDHPDDVEFDRPTLAHRANNAEMLGWYDDMYYYLMDDPTYNTIVSFYRQGNRTFPDSARGIKVKLLECGLLHADPSSTFKHRMRIGDMSPNVLRILRRPPHTPRM